MKRFTLILVNACLCGYLMVGGIAPVQARQPASQPGQRGDVRYLTYLPLVLNTQQSTVKATALSAGEYHNCIITETNGVKCWGYNVDGELGDGTNTNRLIPVDVVGLGSGVKEISAGYKHTCALMTAGGVKCWGLNADGQLGNGTYTSSNKPVDVSGMTSNVTDLRAGGYHTCGMKSNNVMKCWGNNTFSQLGDGTTNKHNTPVNVSTFTTTDVTSIRLGEYFTCVLISPGTLKCWGYNGLGQLGDGTTTDRSSPVSPTGISGVSIVSPGASHTCAVAAAKELFCWGYNAYGQLGNGTTTLSKTPVSVNAMTSAVDGVSAGIRHTCALKDGVLKCWGDNTYGQLGDGTTTDRHVPTGVIGLSTTPKSIRAGGFHTCVLMPTGGVECWGANDFGQLGDNTTNPSSVPVSVKRLP